MIFPYRLFQRLEKAISEAKHSLETLALTRQGTQAELTDFVRTRTEIECIVEDIRNAGVRASGKRDEFAAELSLVEEQIGEKEGALQQLIPEWEAQRRLEAGEKRQLDAANAKLSALFAKQGRVNRFRTKAERDSYLKHEIASMSNYQTAQTSALEATRTSLASSRQAVIEVEKQVTGVQTKIEDGRNRVRNLGEQVAQLKDEHSELTERRKELWREDTKLESQLRHAMEQLTTSERTLATMMDKVCALGMHVTLT